jgi:glycerol-3-phosphate acyltransferase PlsY
MWLFFPLVAFLCGSIPFGLLIARSKGIDIRRHGSKNIGATNVGRVLGRRYGLICFGLDVLKGFAPTLAAGIAMGVAGRWGMAERGAWWWLGVMACAILGHMFSPWVGFRGGKGVATGLGAMLGVFPVLTVAGVGAFLVWIAAMAAWRYVSVASCLAAASLPGWVWVSMRWGRLVGDGGAGPDSAGAPFYVVTGVLALLVVWKHRGNLRRLWAGTEPRAGGRGSAAKGDRT